MMEANAQDIAKAATTSPRSKALAHKIEQLARELRTSLKERIDQ